MPNTGRCRQLTVSLRCAADERRGSWSRPDWLSDKSSHGDQRSFLSARRLFAQLQLVIIRALESLCRQGELPAVHLGRCAFRHRTLRITAKRLARALDSDFGPTGGCARGAPGHRGRRDSGNEIGAHQVDLGRNHRLPENARLRDRQNVEGLHGDESILAILLL